MAKFKKGTKTNYGKFKKYTTDGLNAVVENVVDGRTHIYIVEVSKLSKLSETKKEGEFDRVNIKRNPKDRIGI